MKQVIIILLFLSCCLALLPACTSPQPEHNDSITVVDAQVTGSDTIYIEPIPAGGTVMEWINWFWRNWQAFAGVVMLFLVAYEPIARWTPTDRDNNILRVIQSWIDALLPNRKAGGGQFTAYRTHYDAPPMGYVKTPPEEKPKK